LTLFQRADFTSHSGVALSWKIDCDALTDDDIEALAHMAGDRIGQYHRVIGVPRGGLRLAAAMERLPNLNPADNRVLIVDDVLTTGRSMNEARMALGEEGMWWRAVGLVIFARGPCPVWVRPLFQMPPW